MNPVLMPLTIDEHAQQYNTLLGAVEIAKAVLQEKKDELVKLAQKKGNIPAGAEKSLRLEGDDWTITASFGTSSSLDVDAVGDIQAQLAADHTPGLFKKLFHSRTTYVVAPTAATVLENCSKRLRELFTRVMVTKPKEPSLSVAKKNGKAKKAR